MKNSDTESALHWLNSNPTHGELCAEFPEEWEQVQREVNPLLAQGRSAEVQEYLKRLSKSARPAEMKSPDARLRQIVRYQLSQGAVKQHYTAIASGVESGTVRFNLLNGFIAQKLLFAEGLERKPVSLFWFRAVWPLLWQKRRLMPLVQPEGIYCFYTRHFISQLVQLIGGRNCLEIAAGDGTLARFLARQGASVRATDDYSWEHAVRYPDQVEKLDAKEALRRYAPEVVLCSWPPAGNSFERQVFRTKSVQLYVVIGSRHRHAAGNWGDYLEQTAFSLEDNRELAGLVLPPELDPAVYLFRRN